MWALLYKGLWLFFSFFILATSNVFERTLCGVLFLTVDYLEINITWIWRFLFFFFLSFADLILPKQKHSDFYCFNFNSFFSERGFYSSGWPWILSLFAWAFRILGSQVCTLYYFAFFDLFMFHYPYAWESSLISLQGFFLVLKSKLKVLCMLGSKELYH